MATKKKTKKKTGATRNTEKNTSIFPKVLLVLLVGGFASFLVYLDQIPTEHGITPETIADKGQKKEPKIKAIPKKPKQKFDFYTVLPDRKVTQSERSKVVDNKPKVAVKSQTVHVQPEKVISSKQSKQKTTPYFLYQLQVGAFKELSKADAMKARLAFIGVESNIQVMQNKGQKMYRVRVGPSTDEKKINTIKKQLKAQNINTFVQKLNG